MTDLHAAIAAVAKEHRYSEDTESCWCGWRPTEPFTYWWWDHLSDAILADPGVAAALAERLYESKRFPYGGARGLADKDAHAILGQQEDER